MSGCNICKLLFDLPGLTEAGGNDFTLRWLGWPLKDDQKGQSALVPKLLGLDRKADHPVGYVPRVGQAGEAPHWLPDRLGALVFDVR